MIRGIRTWVGSPSTKLLFFRRIFLLSLQGVGGSGSLWAFNVEVTPYTERNRVITMSKGDELALGKAALTQILKGHEGSFISQDTELYRAIADVCSRIIKVADRPDLEWEVFVIKSNMANAFVLPGGKIFVFTGLLAYTPTPDALAAVLGHEVAHVLARHSAETMTLLSLLNGFLIVVRGIFGETITGNWSTFFSNALVNLAFSRKMEHEADQIGMVLMTKANFNPTHSLIVWERFSQSEENAPPDIPFLRTHPPSGERLIAISEWVEIYQKLQGVVLPAGPVHHAFQSKDFTQVGANE